MLLLPTRPDGALDGRKSWASRVHLGLQDTPPSPTRADAQPIVGTWLSLVERTLGVGEVASSNLVVPTIYFNHLASWI
jgi:hypothetical protein